MELSRKLEELFIGALVIIFGLALAPSINGYAQTAAANSTGIASTVYPFVPAVWVIVIIVLGLGIMNDARKQA